MEYIKVSQFGKRFNMATNTVKKYIESGKIEAVKIGYVTRIPMAFVERFEQQNNKRA